MNTLFRDPSFQWIGLTLIHFLWQGALIALVLAVVLRLSRGASARWRHNASVTALIFLLWAPLTTWIALQVPPAHLDAPSSAGQRVDPSGVQTSAIRPSTIPAHGSGDLLNIIVCAWLLGVVVFGIRLIGGWWQIHRWLRKGVPPANPEWQGRLDGLGRRLQIPRYVRLVETARVSGPVVFGWIRPVILIPVGMLAGLPAAQIEALLLHELAHIRYNDFLINLLQRIAETLLFYHPAMWWVSEQIRRERELRCDDLVVATLGKSLPLAEALLALAEENHALPEMALPALGGSLTGRIRRLLGGAPTGAPGIGRRTKWVLVVAVFTAVGFWCVPIFKAPKLYQSAVIFVEAPPTGGVSTKRESMTLESKSKLEEAISVVRSGGISEKVAEKVKLRERWGIQDTGQLMTKLRSRLHVDPFGVTGGLRVVVADEDPKLAADLADAFAGSFIQFQQRHSEARDDARRFESKRQIEQLEVLLNQSIDELAAFAAKNGVLLTDRGVIERQKVLTDDVDKLRELRQKRRQEMLIAQVERRPIQDWFIIDGAVPALRPSRWYPSGN